MKPRGQHMSIAKIKQRPLKLGSRQKRDVRTQFGALCWRVRKDKVQVALVTSRRSGRWVLPKGWPMEGMTPSDAAAQEAYEEAGLEGKITPLVIGIYSYSKDLDEDDPMPCVVTLFPMKVKKAHKSWPESDLRRRKWVSPRKASKMVDFPELSQILAEFNPRALP